MIKAFILATALAATSANAQTSGSISVTSDYVSRGTSQGDDPALQLYLEHSKENFYVATFLSNVDFDDSTLLETDLFVGYRGSISPSLSYDFSGSYIGYQGTKVSSFNSTGSWDMVEAKGSLLYSTGKLQSYVSAGWTPDYFNIYGPSTWLELGGSTTFKKMSLNASIGRQFLKDNYDYTMFTLGATYSVGKNISATVAYHYTNRPDLGLIYKPRVALTIRKSF